MSKKRKPIRIPVWVPEPLSGPARGVVQTGRGAVDGALYGAIRISMGAVGAAPLRPTVAAAGGLARVWAGTRWNRKRLGRAVSNLAAAYPDADEAWVRQHAIGSYEHLFELGAELIHAPRLMTEDGWRRNLAVGSIEGVVRQLLKSGPVLLLTGHCGNWEMLGYTMALLGFPLHALYRPLDLAPLDRWVREARERRGLILLDKFGALRRLPPLVAAGTPVGFVADQNGGDRGVFVPFFNRLTSTYKSIGLLAMQFGATIAVASASRCAPGEPAPGLDPGGLRYRLELDDCFGPADWSTHPDPLFYLTARYRRSMERLIRRAPEQYLWMHRIWRSRPRHERLQKPFPGSLEEKLRLLPWITDADIGAIKAHSVRDAKTLAETGKDKLS